jgi:hypothetical protein
VIIEVCLKKPQQQQKHYHQQQQRRQQFFLSRNAIFHKAEARQVSKFEADIYDILVLGLAGCRYT